jgi:hypothetical protein
MNEQLKQASMHKKIHVKFSGKFSGNFQINFWRPSFDMQAAPVPNPHKTNALFPRKQCTACMQLAREATQHSWANNAPERSICESALLGEPSKESHKEIEPESFSVCLCDCLCVDSNGPNPFWTLPEGFSAGEGARPHFSPQAVSPYIGPEKAGRTRTRN